ncbi:hypothetical protein TcG_06538 [Trypanosoma cruzi]|nr:hypothetical protein TcG_06538 [Trypanosoma cruzi]
MSFMREFSSLCLLEKLVTFTIDSVFGALMALPVSADYEETLEGVQEKLWYALPSIAKMRADMAEAAEKNADDVAGDAPLEALVEEDPATSAVRKASVPFADMRQLVESLFMACHTNPIADDVEKGVKALLGDAEGGMYTWDNFLQVLRDVESLWLEWHDPEEKWLAVSEKHHASVLKELFDCITQDVEPFGLLPREEVLTAQSVVAHSKTIITPFEEFVEFVKPREFPEIYDTLWGLLVPGVEESGSSGILPVEQFTVFFKWFYLQVFANATEDSAVVAARTMWIEHLNAQGVMSKKQFVRACRRMCSIYNPEADGTKCLETFFRSSAAAIGESEQALGMMAVFEHRRPPSASGRMLIDPKDLYVPEELDEIKQEQGLYDADVAANRIIVYGRRGVGKTAVGKALAKRLNCVHVSLEDLALEAIARAGEGDALGAELLDCVDREAKIPLSQLKLLVHRKLSTDEVLYRGYVFSDFPVLHDAEDADVLEFLNGCGILNVMVPNILLHLSCDDNFYPERLDTTLEERRLLHESEQQLRKAAEEEQKERENFHKALIDRVEQLQAKIKRYEELSAADANVEDPAELEAAKTAAKEAENELPEAIEAQKRDAERSPEISPESAERGKQIRNLALMRILERSLVGDEKRGKEMYVTDLPCFQWIVERLHSVGRCLTVGCTSLIEDTVAYVVETLMLQPCVLPQDLTAESRLPPITPKPEQQQGEEDSILILERENEMKRAVEKAAAELGVAFSTRWKRFCPVTFAECGVLVEGAANYGCVFRRRLYHLASEVKLAKFKANPLPYLSPTPLDREPILVFPIAQGRDAAQSFSNSTVTELVRLLHERLELTPIEFNEFVALWDKHRNLKELREEALAARAKFELAERKLRAERLKKRKAALKKKEKKIKQTLKNKKGRRSTAAAAPPVEEEFKGWEKITEGPETATVRIEKKITEHMHRQKTFVPILVHAFESMSIDAVDRLLGEGVFPEKVVVLQYERPSEEHSNAASPSAEEDGEMSETGKEELPMPQQILLEKLENRMRAGSGDKDDSTPTQIFTIHRLNANKKDAQTLTAEILQIVCPGMAPVEDGVVDVELGEVEDEGTEAGLDEDEESEEGLGPEVADPAVRPGKRFLNQFGTRLQYCPVTLYEKRLLLCGKNELCSQYQGKLYVFSSEEAKEKFERNPLLYIGRPTPTIPPRLWIVGYTKSGRKTLGRKLHEQYHVPFFSYDRRFFERCVEAARKPGGDVVDGIAITEQGSENSYLALAESILKELREFDAEQERCMKLREEAEAVMERREKHEEEDEENEEDLDEEAEARLQEYLEFEPEANEDREVRLSEAYLKIASCVTHIEPFESEGYIMVCPPFSEGDIELLFSTGCIPESTVKLELSEELFFAYKKEARLASIAVSEEPRVVASSQMEVLKKLSEKEQRKKERELRKWRRRHIGKDDPESELEEEDDEDLPSGELRRNGNSDAGANEDDETQSLSSFRNMEQDALAEFEESIADRSVNAVVLNGDLSPNAVFRAATRQLSRFLEHRRSLLYAAEVVRFDVATEMLESGEALLSYFGYTDPVALYDERHGVRRICKWMPNGTDLETEPSTESAEKPSAAADTKASDGNTASNDDAEGDGNHSEEVLEPSHMEVLSEGDLDDEEMSEHDDEEMEEILDAHERRKRLDWLRRCKRVALFCGRLYFFENEASLIRYLRDPLLFVEQPPPLPRPLSKPVVSVYDGKALLSNQEGLKQRCTANHIAFNLHCPLVSLSKLFSWAAIHAPLLSLSRRAIDAVLTGSFDDALVAELLAHRLNAGDAKKSGAVLLNLPRTREQYKLLGERELRVDKVFVFDEANYTDVTSLMTSTATVTVSSLPPPDSIAALAEITECVDVFIRNEGRALLSSTRGFPMNMENTYHTTANVEKHLGPYKWYCPYSWSLHGLLVDQHEIRLYGASFLGHYYYFSSKEYLQHFLLHPGERTTPPGLTPLPSALPSRMPPGTEYSLELLGCCPVTLWDTRDKKGLRGVLEPVAKKGDSRYVVEYEGRHYAMIDEPSLNRFLMCPWKFLEGARLPPSRKAPLPEGQTMSTIDEETFMRRILYDPVAYALIAVAKARPKYPGLSLEESALKFMALHMKCFNEKNTAIQAEQYKANFEKFLKRATLYRSMTEASEDVVKEEEFLELCKEWEMASDKTHGDVSSLVRLRSVD